MATTIQDLEERVDALYNSVLQLQANLNPVIDKSDEAYNTASALTPTIYTKSAYIGDTEVIFDNIPSGQITVHAEDSEGHFPIFDMNKDGSTLTVYFEPLDNVAIFTVSIL